MIVKELHDELRQKYNPDGSTLRSIQLRALDILTEVDRVCRKNDISYWLSSGTLLGAIRHGGFIPWDDDIDIEIFYRDKKDFIKACEKDLPKKFAIQSHKTDKEYLTNIIKIRDISSDYKERFCYKGKSYILEYNINGAFIDVFTEEFSCFFLVKLARKLSLFLLYLKFKMKLNNVILSILYSFLQLIFFVFRCIAYIIPFKKYLYHSYGSIFCSRRAINQVYPLIEVTFEGREFFAPKNYDSYLKSMFGVNYMNLPDERRIKKSHLMES